VVYKDIPARYLVEANPIPEFWISTVEGVTRFLDHQVHKGTVSRFGTTAGGRAMRLVAYGGPRAGKGSTTFSGSIGARDVGFYLGPDASKKVYMAMAGVHGGELEGIVGVVNLITVLETGRDLRGKAWPEITAAAAKLDRILLVPITNLDGRARVPFRMLRHWGADDTVQEYFNTGGWPDGRLIGWPACKQFIPLDFSKTQFPGGYPNDAGVNFQHDDFFGHPQPETRALMELTAGERPDMILNIHTGGPWTVVLREFLEPSLKETSAAHLRRVQTALTLAGLRPTRDVAREADPGRAEGFTFNLSSALNLNCGAFVVLTESPSHMNSPAVRDGRMFVHTPADIVDAQLITHQESMKFLAETGGRIRWSRK
jgi:hypothetical protein